VTWDSLLAPGQERWISKTNYDIQQLKKLYKTGHLCSVQL